jgi:hypothetical protein
MEPKNLIDLRNKIHGALTPELLSSAYRHCWSPDNITAGLCSVAAEAAWFVLGGTPAGWAAWVARDTEAQGTHWWLEHESGLRFDPTEEQYRVCGQVPPYERGMRGHKAGFMGVRQELESKWGFGRKPSLRAAKLLELMESIQMTNKASPRKTRKM